MKSKTFHLQHGKTVYELHLERHEESRVKLRSSKESNPEGVDSLPEITAQISQRGNNIFIKTEHGLERAVALRTDKGVWIQLQDRTAFLEFVRKDVDAASTQPPETEIHAPMTGKVVDVRALPGQKVAASEILVIMEAMKMEFKLEAPMDAVVETVGCEKGQLVDLGQLLIQLQPVADAKS